MQTYRDRDTQKPSGTTSSSMKILLLNWQDIKNPFAGGAEVHLHEIFSRIAKMGHEVTLFCSSFPGSLSEEIIDGMKIVRRGRRSTFNFTLVRYYHSVFRREPFDIVVDDINKIPFYTPLYVRAPLIGIVHHFFGKSIFREVGFIPALYVYVSELLVRPVYKDIPIAVVSQSTRDELEADGFRHDKLATVRNCVNHTQYRPAGIPKSSEPLIGYLGRLKKYKSIDHLLHAFVRVRQSLPHVRLIVVGSGDDQSRLKHLTRNLGLQSAVEFKGFVSDEEKVQLLQQMWCVVNPSLKEGWGLTVIEANACGTPCIASNVPGLRDSVIQDETGLLYPYGDINALTSAIHLMLTDEKTRHRLGEGALRWARTFDWQVEATKMLKLLEGEVAQWKNPI